MTEIETRAEASPDPRVAELLAQAETALPAGHASLAEMTAFLNAAAALERAKRPTVLHEASPTVHAAPAGASVYVPMPPSQAHAATPPLQPEKRSLWPLIFVTSMSGVISAGYACAATGSSVAVIAVTGFAGIWGLSVHRLVFARQV